MLRCSGFRLLSGDHVAEGVAIRLSLHVGAEKGDDLAAEVGILLHLDHDDLPDDGSLFLGEAEHRGLGLRELRFQPLNTLLRSFG